MRIPFRPIGLAGFLAIAILSIVIGQRVTGRVSTLAPPVKGPAMETATFGMGCFWGAESAFRHLPGVIDTRVGYTGGTLSFPTYEEVCTGKTGHTEVIEVTYDPTLISYRGLLRLFWDHHDPAVIHKAQYKSAIYYHTPAQREEAEADRERAERSGAYGHPIVTEILPAPPFYPAEEYHQRYHEKHGITSGCGAPGF